MTRGTRARRGSEVPPDRLPLARQLADQLSGQRWVVPFLALGLLGWVLRMLTSDSALAPWVGGTVAVLAVAAAWEVRRQGRIG